MAHAVEALYSPAANPLLDLVAEEGLRVMAGALRMLAADLSDREARERALYAGWLCGRALAEGGTGLHHKLCHLLGGTFGLPHAETHAILLPHVVGFLAPDIPGPMAVLRRALAGGHPTAILDGLAAELGVPRGLKAIGLDEGGRGQGRGAGLRGRLSEPPSAEPPRRSAACCAPPGAERRPLRANRLRARAGRLLSVGRGHVRLGERRPVQLLRDLAMAVPPLRHLRESRNALAARVADLEAQLKGSGNSSFFHYAASFDATGMMRRHAVADLQPDPNHLTNFLGVKIAPKFLPEILQGRQAMWRRSPSRQLARRHRRMGGGAAAVELAKGDSR